MSILNLFESSNHRNNIAHLAAIVIDSQEKETVTSYAVGLLSPIKIAEEVVDNSTNTLVNTIDFSSYKNLIKK